MLKNILIVIYLGMLAACTATSEPDTDKAAATATDPKLEAEFNRAVSILRSGNQQQAFQLFTEITKKYPTSSGAHVNIGLVYLNSNKLDKAETAFKTALKINNNNRAAYNGLGVVYRKAGKFKEAEQAYLSALAIDNTYAIAHLNFGILNDIYFDQPATALHHYQQYMKYSDKKDKDVEKWIIDVERRSKNDKRKG